MTRCSTPMPAWCLRSFGKQEQCSSALLAVRVLVTLCLNYLSDRYQPPASRRKWARERRAREKAAVIGGTQERCHGVLSLVETGWIAFHTPSPQPLVTQDGFLPEPYRRNLAGKIHVP